MRVLKIISGGQTGVDRAALDVAIELGIPHGGWCPRGRKAEDGRIPERYDLLETASRGYQGRTYKNIVDSDATLILIDSPRMTPGSALTQRTAWRVPRACMVARIGAVHPAEIHEWLRDSLSERDGKLGVRVLNVAGTRERMAPGIYDAAKAFLLEVLR